METAQRLIANVDRMIQGGRLTHTVEISKLKALLHVQADRKEAFATLQKFRSKISGSKELSTKPFTARKRMATIYTVTFYAIASVLLFLSLFVFISAPNWFYAMYVGHSWLIKALVGTFGVSLAGGAAAIASNLRPETEAVIHLSSKTRRRLRQTYWLKTTSLTRKAVSESNDTVARLKHLKAAYQDAKSQIDDIKDENNILLRQISRATFLDVAGKEELFNQALSELDLRLQEILGTFRDYQE